MPKASMPKTDRRLKKKIAFFKKNSTIQRIRQKKKKKIIFIEFKTLFITSNIFLLFSLIFKIFFIKHCSRFKYEITILQIKNIYIF